LREERHVVTLPIALHPSLRRGEDRGGEGPGLDAIFPNTR
jgi:hypothetical protein